MSNLINKRPDDWDAPEGAVFVCGACGKHSARRDEVGDESCFLNAVLCEASSLVFNGRRVVSAKAWKEP